MEAEEYLMLNHDITRRNLDKYGERHILVSLIWNLKLREPRGQLVYVKDVGVVRTELQNTESIRILTDYLLEYHKYG